MWKYIMAGYACLLLARSCYVGTSGLPNFYIWKMLISELYRPTWNINLVYVSHGILNVNFNIFSNNVDHYFSSFYFKNIKKKTRYYDLFGGGPRQGSIIFENIKQKREKMRKKTKKKSEQAAYRINIL